MAEFFGNPYSGANGIAQPFQTPFAQLPRYQVARVRGQQGAEQFPMANNSSVFLADDTDPNRIWLVITDEAGYRKVRPIDAKFADLQDDGNTLEAISKRLKRLEDIIDERINPGSNSAESARASAAKD